MENESRTWVSTSYSVEHGGLKLGRISGSLPILALAGSVLAGFFAIAVLMALGLSIMLSLLMSVTIPAVTYLFLLWLSTKPEGYLEDWMESLLIRYSKHELFKNETQYEDFQ